MFHEFTWSFMQSGKIDECGDKVEREGRGKVVPNFSAWK